MKTFILLLTICASSLSFANTGLRNLPSDPNHCGRGSTCQKGYIWLLKAGTYYARGTGSSCESAMEASEDNFIRSYGDMSCGLISGPHSWSCFKSRDGRRFVSWHQCSPDSGSSRPAARSRCANIGGTLVCN